MRKDGGPAFPFATHTQDQRGVPMAHIRDGMTLRDYFAAAALQGIIAYGPDAKMMDMAEGARGGAHEARAAYAWADAMLAERSRD